MAKKRGNNEGSIFKTEYGTWRALITINGRRLSFTADSQQECQDWIRKMSSQIESGLTYSAAQTSYGEFLSDWMVSAKASLSHNTWKQYNQIVRDYIIPELGRKKLLELRPDHIQALYDKKIREGKSLRTVQFIHGVIRTSLYHALKLGVINKNPAIATKPPKPKPKEMNILNEDQVQQLIVTGQLKCDQFTELYQIAISTGMRQGELLGLQWKDIDWDKRTIHIRRQLKRLHGGGYEFSTPKTKSGIRKIKVGSQLIEVLEIQKHRVSMYVFELMDQWKEHDLVFPARTGKPLSQSYLISRFKRLLAEANLPKIRFHDLRHTAASLMLNNGVPVLIVSKRLGHAKPSITLDVYGHMISNMQEKAAEVMDQFIIPLEIPSPSPVAPGLHRKIDSEKNNEK